MCYVVQECDGPLWVCVPRTTPSLPQLAVARTVNRRTTELRLGVLAQGPHSFPNPNELGASAGSCRRLLRPEDSCSSSAVLRKPRDIAREEGRGERVGWGAFGLKRARANVFAVIFLVEFESCSCYHSRTFLPRNSTKTYSPFCGGRKTALQNEF